MILLICGGRKFINYDTLDQSIKGLPQRPTMIIHSGASGADKLAKQWAEMNQIHCAEIPALWKQFGNSAGPHRNDAMLLLKPDICLAMPGGTGTADMMSKCGVAGIACYYG